MPSFFRSVAPSGKRSLAFVGRAASRLLTTLQSVYRPERQDIVPETGQGSDRDEETVTSILAAADSGTSDSSSDTSELLDSYSSDSSTEDAEDENAVLNALSEDELEYAASMSDIDADDAELAIPSNPNLSDVDEAVQSGVHSGCAASVTRRRNTHSAVRRPYHPYRYSAAPFSPATSHLQEHLTNSPIRGRRDFCRAHHLPSQASAIEEVDALSRRHTSACTGCPPSRVSPVNSSGSDGWDSRDRKRKRGPDDAAPAAGPSTSLAERPRIRRRLSAPRPRCTRETCLALNLHLLAACPSAPNSDDEDAWSNTAQPSDTDPDPAAEHHAYRRAVRAFRRGEKRLRDDADNSIDEPGPSTKRQRSGEQ
ncbi:hypothetical protein BD414DRAFT_527497 [Trametes punicea]|nr:hypothetical protein BD414DRAFT_527497 [Trametes punicea]